MQARKIAVLVGSLRKESWNRKTALALMSLASPSLQLELVEIGQLSHYNQDYDENPPSAWSNFRQKIKTFDGVLFITPEYNRSVPAVLKNALDIGSRPYGHSVWAGKPCAIVSVSIGAIGGFGANHHLRQSLVFLDMPCLAQPEAYLSNAANLFDNNGNITNQNTVEFLQKFMASFEQWVKTHTQNK